MVTCGIFNVLYHAFCSSLVRGIMLKSENVLILREPIGLTNEKFTL